MVFFAGSRVKKTLFSVALLRRITEGRWGGVDTLKEEVDTLGFEETSFFDDENLETSFTSLLFIQSFGEEDSQAEKAPRVENLLPQSSSCEPQISSFNTWTWPILLTVNLKSF
jgi:hypothetical protein